MSKEANKTATAPIGTQNRVVIPIALMREMPWGYRDCLSLEIQEDNEQIIIRKVEEAPKEK